MIRKRGVVGPVVALVGMLAILAPAVAQSQISAEDFLDRLQQAGQLADLNGETPTPQRMADVRAAIGLPVGVAVADWLVEIQRDPVLEGLSGSDAADFQLAAERLAALERAVGEVLAADPPSTGRMAAALAQAYRGVAVPQPDVFETALVIVRDVLQGILQRVGNLVAGAGGALALVALIVIVVGAVAIFVVPSRLVPDRISGRHPTGSGITRSVDWAAKAEDALRAGDLHEGIRWLYLALLGVLAGRGIVRDAPALTAGEARVAVLHNRPSIFPAIALATESYERVVYGGATPNSRDVDVLREATAQARKP